MQNTIKITEDLYWVGASDRRLALFENVFPIPRGVSYNSYLLADEKTVLLDTVDTSVGGQFFENLEFALAGKQLDYIIVNHMEPDHCATLEEVSRRFPNAKVVCNQKTVGMIKQFFNFDIDSRAYLVKEGDILDCGRHKLTFLMAPMVHWPEVMVTYDTADKILFSADAFGTFGAINGNLFADELDFDKDWLPDARRYYTNIVGKYDNQVQALLRKAETVEINMICPLHGPVWRSDIGYFIDKYSKWSTNTPEDNSVMIAYASVYGNTENAVNILASGLAARGVRNIAMYDVSSTHPSVIVSEAFRCSHLIFASTTYNAGIFCNMETVLLDIAAHNIKNRTIALIENGTWAPTANKLMREILDKTKNNTILENTLTIKSVLKDNQRADLEALADAVVQSMGARENISSDKSVSEINNEAFFKIQYGLFVLSANDGGRDNGCIINTVMQVTDTPKRVAFAVNKQNLTHDMVLKSKSANISILTTDAPFSLFKNFGFQSGSETDKFADFSGAVRAENGILYLSKHTNAVVSLKVIKAEDCGTHTLFTADVTAAAVLSDKESVSYDYYFENIKPKPQLPEQKKGYICKICGYVYEGDDLPEDFICPLCKHGAEDFEPIG